MRKKRCAWGTCNSVSRYSSEDYMTGVTFRPFPKPKTQLEKCREWIRLYNSPHTDLSVDKIGGRTNGASVDKVGQIWSQRRSVRCYLVQQQVAAMDAPLLRYS
ncbi:extensin-1-like [Plakobranchus ocellatus]|uniref:Extensin-1-like n=1 Tax=Plakobranchus ocellatus TaxID=259542 RepID=A0AAV3ZW16_9GAST|nr:extensin-1-like [Plakobranchus ocellatus]